MVDRRYRRDRRGSAIWQARARSGSGIAAVRALQGGVGQVGSAEVHLVQDSPRQCCTVEIRIAEIGPGQGRAAQVGHVQGGPPSDRSNQRSGAQVGAGQICAAQVGVQQVGADEVGAGEIGVAEDSVAQGGPGEAGAFQDGVDEGGVGQVGVDQESAGQVGAGQVHAVQIGTAQIGIAQVRRGAGRQAFRQRRSRGGGRCPQHQNGQQASVAGHVCEYRMRGGLAPVPFPKGRAATRRRVAARGSRVRGGADSSRRFGLWGIPPHPSLSIIGRRPANLIPLPIIGDEMNVPAENRDGPVIVPMIVGGTDRSPVLWQLVVAALLMPAVAMTVVVLL